VTPLQPELLRAICERPFDDNLRLIAADWWEEAGEPNRAEFVRVQCQIADLDAEMRSTEDCGSNLCPGCEVRRGLQKRELELTELLWERMCPFLMLIPNKWIFRNGFVDEVHCSLADWQGYGLAIVACQPVTRLVLTDIGSITALPETIREANYRRWLNWARLQAGLPSLE